MISLPFNLFPPDEVHPSMSIFPLLGSFHREVQGKFLLFYEVMYFVYFFSFVLIFSAVTRNNPYLVKSLSSFFP